MPSRIWKISEIGSRAGASTIHIQNNLPDTIKEIAFDTRLIFSPAQTLFVALQGQGRDGHSWIGEAFSKGVRNFLVSDASWVPGDANYLLVNNTLDGLHKWASSFRNEFKGKVVAITGSNGKTTVKEWLASLLQLKYHIYKSPKSFNSQLGVPLSVLQADPDAEILIFEAGISRPGEMEKLDRILQPQVGILTHLGDAHADGFPSFDKKIREKLKLFDGCKTWICSTFDNDEIESIAKEEGLIQLISAGKKESDRFFMNEIGKEDSGWHFHFNNEKLCVPVQIRVPGEAALENAFIALCASIHLGLDTELAADEIKKLRPVSMRTELITDNPEITVINDAYNADAASIRNAFALLASGHDQANRILIMSDIEHQGAQQESIQKEILEEAIEKFGAANIRLVGPVFSRIGSDSGCDSFETTEDFIRRFNYHEFQGSTVLLKGARKFELEKLIPFLTRRSHSTFLRISLDDLVSNYRAFRSKIPAGTSLMAMVKAFAYGSGSWEIAEALTKEGVNYFAVAATSEGIALRTKGISVPIMVMSPDESSIEQLVHFQLEPEVFSMRQLHRYKNLLYSEGLSKLRIHLKVDTGMGRLGIHPDDSKQVSEFLLKNTELEVVSILSHLASADEPEQDDYTLEQIQRFKQFCDEIENAIGKKTMRHILNTSGVMRFPDHVMDMVRIGIGLYGVDPTKEQKIELKEIGTLQTSVVQIHDYPKGTYVGYGCSQVTKRKSRIATIPVGYADGIRRSLGNGKISFLVKGKRAPTFGRICMDLLMIDVTNIPDVKEGDEVIVFGRQGEDFISVNELAEAAGTIPYEILAGISQRVQRVYVKE